MPRSRQLSILSGHPPGDKVRAPDTGQPRRLPCSARSRRRRRGTRRGGGSRRWPRAPVGPARASPVTQHSCHVVQGARRSTHRCHRRLRRGRCSRTGPAPDSISPTSAGFDGVSELPQPRRELQQHIVAVQPGSLINGRDARFDSADLGDERFHPVGRADVAREVP